MTGRDWVFLVLGFYLGVAAVFVAVAYTFTARHAVTLARELLRRLDA